MPEEKSAALSDRGREPFHGNGGRAPGSGDHEDDHGRDGAVYPGIFRQSCFTFLNRLQIVTCAAKNPIFPAKKACIPGSGVLNYYTYDLQRGFCACFSALFCRKFKAERAACIPGLPAEYPKEIGSKKRLVFRKLPLQNPAAGRRRRTQDVKGGFLR